MRPGHPDGPTATTRETATCAGGAGRRAGPPDGTALGRAYMRVGESMENRPVEIDKMEKQLKQWGAKLDDLAEKVTSEPAGTDGDGRGWWRPRC